MDVCKSIAVMLSFFVYALLHTPVASRPAGIGLSCPMHGCTPHRSFSFLSPELPSQVKVNWTWGDAPFLADHGQTFFRNKGCSSSSSALVCPTDRGDVHLDPTSGNMTWNITTDTSPYLPVLDFNGRPSVLTSDSEKFTVVTSQGRDTVNLTKYSPMFGAVTSSDGTIVVTSSNKDTPQVLAFDCCTQSTDNMFAAIRLSGNFANTSGTFIPCGQPVINESRVYVITRFVPASRSYQVNTLAPGSKRLYALDISKNLTSDRIIWFRDLPHDSFGKNQNSKTNQIHPNASIFPDARDLVNNDDIEDETILAFHNDTIYVNYATTTSSTKRAVTSGQPYTSPMFAVRDVGNTSELSWHTETFLGAVAMWDVVVPPTDVMPTKVVWVVNRSPAMIVGHDVRTGKAIQTIAVSELTSKADGFITSDLMVTRQPGNPDTDVLLFATENNLRAYVVAVEMGLQSKTRLLWSVDVSGPEPDPIMQWSVGGQMASNSWHFRLGVAVTGCALATADVMEIVCQNFVSVITSGI